MIHILQICHEVNQTGKRHHNRKVGGNARQWKTEGKGCCIACYHGIKRMSEIISSRNMWQTSTYQPTWHGIDCLKKYVSDLLYVGYKICLQLILDMFDVCARSMATWHSGWQTGSACARRANMTIASLSNCLRCSLSTISHQSSTLLSSKASK